MQRWSAIIDSAVIAQLCYGISARNTIAFRQCTEVWGLGPAGPGNTILKTSAGLPGSVLLGLPH
jgi:hypothetical protein